MRKSIFVLSALLCLNSYSIWADDTNGVDQEVSHPCGIIAKACINAGYAVRGGSSSNKNFWINCMKPLLLGQSVDGVTVPADTAKTCRQDKIQSLKSELQEFMNANN